MEDKIVGYLKFSDFEGGIITHFDHLKRGILYFTPTSSFINDELEEAQIADEGALKAFTVSGWETYENFAGTTIETPHGIKFHDPSHITTTSSAYFGQINKESIKHFYENSSNDADIYWNINNFADTLVYEFGRFSTYYLIKSANIMINKDNNWGITCFVTIHASDIKNKHLSEQLIHSLTKETKNSKDNIGFKRPWIYISKEEMDSVTAKIKLFGISSWSGEVNYIGSKDPYPFSREELIINPGKVLLCKPCLYANQREFRLIVGGPNKNFPSLVDQSMPLIKPTAIKYGNDTESLRKLIVN